MKRGQHLFIVIISMLCVLLAGALDLRSQNTQNTRATAAPVLPPLTKTTALPQIFHEVVRVIDGDTIIARLAEGDVRIRLIGINAPESVDPERPVQCFGKEAAEHLRLLLKGAPVLIETDATQDRYDKYGRLLAYISTTNRKLVNQEMIDDGYAYEYTYRTPYQYQAAFRQAEDAARVAQRGLWSPATCNGKF